MERLVRGVEAYPGAELFDDVAEVGPGGNFLATQAARARGAERGVLEPALIGRVPYDAWLHAGAAEHVRAGAGEGGGDPGGPMVDPLPDETMAELDRILAEADRALAE